jgi:DNA N-6-adenine-methyltransferase (Dam)
MQNMGKLIELSSRRKMPAQKPGRSRQDYATPKIFIDAVKAHFGIKRFDFDLAAVRANAVDNLGPADLYLGPDHSNVMCRDALLFDWSRTPKGNLWLNPPFAHIAPWAAKCNTARRWVMRGGIVTRRRIFLLVPAAVGANWWRDSVHNKARVVFLNGRIYFDGVSPYPKDCALCVYGDKPGYEIWSWGKE